MNLSLVYKTAFKNSKPFEELYRSAEEVSMATLIAGIVDELAEKKNEISFIGLFLCYLKTCGLGLNDLEYSLEYILDERTFEKYMVDKILYSNFCDNKLFEEFNNLKKTKPNFFKRIIDFENQNVNEQNITYSEFLIHFSERRFFTKVLRQNLSNKNLANSDNGKGLIRFIDSIYETSKPQEDHLKVVEHELKVIQKSCGDRFSPDLVRRVMQSMIDEYEGSRVETAKNARNNTPKNKISNKKTLISSAEVEKEEQENQSWHKISELGKYVIGQDEAVDKVIEKIMGSYVGFKSEKEPIATFLLTGPTGVGKTETAKGVADLCFDKKLFVVDMTTFKNDGDISRLLGGSPNYVGYNDPNAFCNFVQQNPNCVLLFDEIDKADKGCLDLLMRMIDEGEFINAKGEVVSLRDAVIICTTNLTEYVEDKTSRVEEKITNKDGLRKEIVGRFNEVIEYKPLTKDACKQIAEKFFLSKNIENFETRNQDKFLKLEYSDDLLDKIVDDANYRLFGARDLKKSIQKNFISPITKYIIRNNPYNQTLYVDKDCVKPVEPQAEKTTTENRFENKGME